MSDQPKSTSINQALSPEDVCAKIIESLYEGVSVKASCERYSYRVRDFYKTVSRSGDLSQDLYLAEIHYMDVLAKETIDIADNEDNPIRAKTRIQARQWLASRLSARKYGDRVQVDIDQKVDLTVALEAAKLRVLQPDCNPILEHQPQSIDMKDIYSANAPDKISGAFTNAADKK